MIWFYGGNIEKNEKWFVLLLNHININCHISNNHIVKKNIFVIKMRLFIWKSYKNMMANRGRLDTKGICSHFSCVFMHACVIRFWYLNCSVCNYILPYFFQSHVSQTDIDECEPHPCQNGGTCTDDMNDYNCACVPGYSGKNCDVGECLGRNILVVILLSQ